MRETGGLKISSVSCCIKTKQQPQKKSCAVFKETCIFSKIKLNTHLRKGTSRQSDHSAVAGMVLGVNLLLIDAASGHPAAHAPKVLLHFQQEVHAVLKQKHQAGIALRSVLHHRRLYKINNKKLAGK